MRERQNNRTGMQHLELFFLAAVGGRINHRHQNLTRQNGCYRDSKKSTPDIVSDTTALAPASADVMMTPK